MPQSDQIDEIDDASIAVNGNIFTDSLNLSLNVCRGGKQCTLHTKQKKNERNENDAREKS